MWYGKEKILKQGLNRYKYRCVTLCKNGVKKLYTTHSLVAKMFVLNLENKPCVNHIDGDKSNNTADNLEFCTYSENNRHSYDTGLRKLIHINQYSMNNNFIKTWDRAIEVERELKIDRSSIIKCCKNKRKTAGGYIWIYKD